MCRPPRRPRDLSEHAHDLRLQFADVGLDLRQRPRRNVDAEVAVEVDLVAHLAEAAVLRVAHGIAHPGVGHVRRHLARHVLADVLAERPTEGLFESQLLW
jgi:hypothetical protein